jgi:hypothetical protein
MNYCTVVAIIFIELTLFYSSVSFTIESTDDEGYPISPISFAMGVFSFSESRLLIFETPSSLYVTMLSCAGKDSG